MVNSKELKALMKNTGSIPWKYGIAVERLKLKKIRIHSEKAKEIFESIDARISDKNIKSESKKIISYIKALARLGQSTQVCEMKLINRFNKVGRILLKSKDEIDGLEEFINACKEIKELTRKNFDETRRSLRMGGESLGSLLRRISPFAAKGTIAKLGEIELWRREAVKYVLTQQFKFTNIKKGSFDKNLKEFTYSAIKEMRLLRKITINWVILLVETRLKFENLKKQKSFAKYVKKANRVLRKAGNDLSKRAKVSALRIAGIEGKIGRVIPQ